MKNQKPAAIKATCPACRETVHFSEQDIEESGYVDCPQCWELLQLTSLKPLKFTIASLDDDDGDEDYFEDED